MSRQPGVHCFAVLAEHGYISCDCAISGEVNIAGGLFKKANDLKCWLFFPTLLLLPLLFHLNCLQKADLPEHPAVLTAALWVVTFPFVICQLDEQKTAKR